MRPDLSRHDLEKTLSAGSEHDYSKAGFWSDRNEAWNDFLPGIKRRILVNTSVITLAFYKLQPGSEVPLHNHPQVQYGICMKGGGVFTVADKSWKLNERDAYYIPPSVTHGLNITSPEETWLIEGFAPMRRDFLKETLPADGP